MTSPVPGTFCLVLHSHLPWLPGHGVWPLGEEWLFQAWVESYLPLVSELDSLAAEGHRDVLTLGVTPVLAAQLDHPRMRRDVGTWVGLAQQRARELGFDPDPARRRAATEEYAAGARAERLLTTRWSGGGSPVLRSLRESGVVELLGGPPAHPFLPLLVPEVAALALESGLSDSTWRLGERPRGIWSPECGWSPGLGATFDAAAVDHFVVDEQLVRDAGGHPHAAWRVAGSSVVAVPRDLEVTNLVWSSRTGYPAAAPYRDFHAREEFTGIRLWAVGSNADGTKAPYDAAAASEQVDRDVDHFVAAVGARLEQVHATTGAPGLVVAAYDTELFGHWWHEGPAFVGQAIRALRANGIRVDTLANTLARDGGVHVAGDLDLGAGSWGAGKDFSVWDGPDVADLARENLWLQHRWLAVIDRERTAGRLGNRRPDLDQLLLTLWNALSSDWAFLVSRGQSVDYAVRRAQEHRTDFHRLAQLVEDGDAVTALAEASRQARHDRTFPEYDARITPGR